MRLQEKYKTEIIPKLKEKFGYKNDMQVPKIQKVTLNVGFGRRSKEKQYIKAVIDALAKISGQKPVVNKAKKSIASFKLREGDSIGASATLRGKRMYDFIEKLVNISFPRIRDFRGISEKSVDNTGNLTIGFKEHIAFPEVRSDEIENIFGLEISLSTSTKDYKQGLELFKLLGFPFKKQ